MKITMKKARKAVGDKMEIHVEFHSMWNLPTAIRIAEALEQFDPFWYEDPIKMNNIDAVADYAHRTNVWVTASETLGTRWGFRELFEKQAVSVCMLDVGWTGGLSESKKIATMAEAIVLVVRVGRTKRQQMVHAAELMYRVDARLVGVVLNMARSKSRLFGGRWAHSRGEYPPVGAAASAAVAAGTAEARHLVAAEHDLLMIAARQLREDFVDIALFGHRGAA